MTLREQLVHTILENTQKDGALRSAISPGFTTLAPKFHFPRLGMFFCKVGGNPN
jgi:hypothetical protein